MYACVDLDLEDGCVVVGRSMAPDCDRAASVRRAS